MASHRPSRRRVLRDLLALGVGGAALGPALGVDPLIRLARAQGGRPEAPTRHYVICAFAGGWDTLLSLDPRDPRAFPSTLESIDATGIQPAYELLPRPGADIVRLPTAAGDTIEVGPYFGQMARHIDDVAIVRGIDMETVAHPAGYRRFITGRPPSGTLARGSSGSTWLTARVARDELMPQLSLGVESYNVEQPQAATAIFANNNTDLLRLLRPDGTRFDPGVTAAIDAHIAAAADCGQAAASPAWSKAEFGRRQAQTLVASGLWQQFDFNARGAPEIDALRERFAGLGTGPMRNAAVAYQALTRGISRVVCASMAGGTLDTHGPDWITEQGPRQEAGWDALAALIDALKATEYGDGTSWFAHTTILVFSEFSRTPALNSISGRDHHIVTSCLLTGGAVRGGQVIGATSDVGMFAEPIDLATGRLDPGGEVLGPEHIWRTLFDEVGIPRGAAGGPDFRVDGLGTLLRA